MVQRFLLITAVPGILAGVMQVYQQVLRGVDKANQALMGGVMQLVTKNCGGGCGRMGNAESGCGLAWLARLLCGRNRDPVLLLSEDRAGNRNRIKQKAPPEGKSLSGGAVY